LLDHRLSTISQHHWTNKLLGFDIRIEFKPGIANVVVDALSHHNTRDTTSLMALFGTTFKMFDDVWCEFDDDTSLDTFCDGAVTGIRGPNWRVLDGLLIINGQVYMPPTSSCFQAVLVVMQDIGHEGIERTLHRLCADFNVAGACVLMKDFVYNCSTCQCNKGEHLQSTGLLQPLEVPFAV
jgi:hypothetical protein